MARSTTLALLFLTAAAGTWTATAQSPSPTPKPKVAHVRFWNMLPYKPNGNTLALFEADNKMLTAGGPVNCSAEYWPVVPGTYTFTVCRPENVASPIKRLPATLPADTFITILVTEKDGQPTVEATNDTIDPKTVDNTAHLALRQLVAGAQVTVAAGTASTASALSYGAVATLDNLPAAQVTVSVRATMPNGKIQTWTAPIDFTADHYGTLLIVNDAYGQFNPCYAVNGHGGIGPPSRR